MRSGWLVAVVVVVVTGHPRNDCNYVCPANYAPVCGSDGTTYPNRCVLDGVSKCTDPNLTYDHKGECGIDCPYGCPAVWDPVCGSDGKTYGNKCELDVAKICYDTELTISHKGECKNTDCPKACYDIYDPVCGSDGHTYHNECELESERDCNGKPDLTLDHKGEC